MKSYLVVWRDEGEFTQSQVLMGVVDPHQMTNNEWVYDAAISEGYSEEEAKDLINRGYELILVCDFPSVFYDQ